jgi:hypothetical protein
MNTTTPPATGGSSDNTYMFVTMIVLQVVQVSLVFIKRIRKSTCCGGSLDLASPEASGEADDASKTRVQITPPTVRASEDLSSEIAKAVISAMNDRKSQ